MTNRPNSPLEQQQESSTDHNELNPCETISPENTTPAEIARENTPSQELDRSFDKLAERFARKVYGGLKGEIRLAVLWADLQILVDKLIQKTEQPLRILDVGGGLGQLAIRLAALGHHVTINDLSPVMLDTCRQSARDAGVEDSITWICGPYQSLPKLLDDQGTEAFDLILCHALLEWLEKPERLIPALMPLLRPGAYLSLCFYNPAAKIYRNLIRGNFDWLQEQANYRSDEGSLTPNNPCSFEQVQQWLLQSGFTIESVSGVRVFHDYVVERRGGHQNPEQVLAMELSYSRLEPFKWLGRYLHIVARR